jgi:hypothetical protein
VCADLQVNVQRGDESLHQLELFSRLVAVGYIDARDARRDGQPRNIQRILSVDARLADVLAQGRQNWHPCVTNLVVGESDVWAALLPCEGNQLPRRHLLPELRDLDVKRVCGGGRG